MPINFNEFLRQARNATFDTRTIAVDNAQNPQNVKHGRFLISNSQKVNIATMTAFKDAL